MRLEAIAIGNKQLLVAIEAIWLEAIAIGNKKLLCIEAIRLEAMTPSNKKLLYSSYRSYEVGGHCYW